MRVLSLDQIRKKFASLPEYTEGYCHDEPHMKDISYGIGWGSPELVTITVDIIARSVRYEHNVVFLGGKYEDRIYIIPLTTHFHIPKDFIAFCRYMKQFPSKGKSHD